MGFFRRTTSAPRISSGTRGADAFWVAVMLLTPLHSLVERPDFFPGQRPVLIRVRPIEHPLDQREVAAPHLPWNRIPLAGRRHRDGLGPIHASLGPLSPAGPAAFAGRLSGKPLSSWTRLYSLADPLLETRADGPARTTLQCRTSGPAAGLRRSAAHLLELAGLLLRQNPLDRRQSFGAGLVEDSANLLNLVVGQTQPIQSKPS